MSVISYIIDINSYFGDKKYPAQTLKVAGDLCWASGAFENPDHLPSRESFNTIQY